MQTFPVNDFMIGVSLEVANYVGVTHAVTVLFTHTNTWDQLNNSNKIFWDQYLFLNKYLCKHFFFLTLLYFKTQL